MAVIIAFYLSGLFNMISAAITPGIHPQIQSINVISIEPQPLSRTASGGQIIARRTLQKLIVLECIRLSNFLFQLYDANFTSLLREEHI